MNVKELMDVLSKCPPEATVYVEADHGQQPEQASSFFISLDDTIEYYGDEMTWQDPDEGIPSASVSAVLVGY